jgi:hypothetical protein
MPDSALSALTGATACLCATPATVVSRNALRFLSHFLGLSGYISPQWESAIRKRTGWADLRPNLYFIGGHWVAREARIAASLTTRNRYFFQNGTTSQKGPPFGRRPRQMQESLGESAVTSRVIGEDCGSRLGRFPIAGNYRIPKKRPTETVFFRMFSDA